MTEHDGHHGRQNYERALDGLRNRNRTREAEIDAVVAELLWAKDEAINVLRDTVRNWRDHAKYLEQLIERATAAASSARTVADRVDTPPERI